MARGGLITLHLLGAMEEILQQESLSLPLHQLLWKKPSVQLKATNAMASVSSFFKRTGPHYTSEGGDAVACGRGDRWQGYGSNSKPPRQHVFRDGELLHRSSSGERVAFHAQQNQ